MNLLVRIFIEVVERFAVWKFRWYLKHQREQDFFTEDEIDWLLSNELEIP